jgi:hypothetical protein
MGKET